MEDISELGTDFNNSWDFKDGDLIFISNTDNLIQAITNRLNTRLGSMSDFYYNYGSYIRSFTGARKNEEMLEFIKLEVDSCLKQDPRLQNYNIIIEYGEKGRVHIYVTVIFDDETELTLSLVLTEDGVVNSDGD